MKWRYLSLLALVGALCPSLAFADTFGKTTVGGFVDTIPSGYTQAFGDFSPVSNGTATSMSIYTVVAGKQCKLYIYGDSSGHPGALLKGTLELTTATNAWVTADLTSNLTVTTGTKYYLAEQCAQLLTGMADTASQTDFYINGQTYGSQPDPFPGGYSTDNIIKSIYVTYTPDGGGGTTGGGGGGGSGTGSVACLTASGCNLAFTGSLIITHSACTAFVGSGGSVCSMWDTAIEVPAVYFFVRQARDLVVFTVLISCSGGILFLIIKSIIKWFHFRITQR